MNMKQKTVLCVTKVKIFLKIKHIKILLNLKISTLYKLASNFYVKRWNASKNILPNFPE